MVDLLNPPRNYGLGKTRSLDRRGKVPSDANLRGLAQTVSIDRRIQPTLAEALREIGVRATAGTGSEEAFAEGLIKFEAVATATDADASIAIMVRASVGDAFEEAGIYLDANVSGLGGASRIRIEADNVVISDGSDIDPVFEFVGGQLYLRNVVLVTAIDNDVVATDHVQDDAITAIWTNVGDTPSTGTFATINTTRRANTELIIIVTWASVAVVPAVGTDLTIGFQFKRGSTVLDATVAFLCLFDPDFTAPDHISTGGPYGSQAVDDDNVSGSQTYTFVMTAGEINGWRITMIERKK